MRLICKCCLYTSVYGNCYSRNKKSSVFLLSYRNTSGGLEEQEMLWEDEPQANQVLPNFHECCYNSIKTRRTCFLFLLENIMIEKGKQLVDCDYQNVNSLCSYHHCINSLCYSVILCFYQVLVCNSTIVHSQFLCMRADLGCALFNCHVIEIWSL